SGANGRSCRDHRTARGLHVHPACPVARHAELRELSRIGWRVRVQGRPPRHLRLDPRPGRRAGRPARGGEPGMTTLDDLRAESARVRDEVDAARAERAAALLAGEADPAVQPSLAAKEARLALITDAEGLA